MRTGSCIHRAGIAAAIVAVLAPPIAGAAEAASTFASPAVAGRASDGTAGHLLQMILALCVVLALVVGLAWFSRRIRSAVRPNGLTIDVIAQSALGTKERAVIVKVGQQSLLLGVAPGSVTLLHVIPESTSQPAEEATNAAAAAVAVPKFADLLRRSLGQS